MRRPARKLCYKIGEVCRMCDVEPHVLRYWENEFPGLAPDKNSAGQRIYRDKDIEMVRTIQRLLHEEGYTIAGARRKLKEETGGRGLPLFEDSAKAVRRRTLAELRAELEGMLDILGED